MMFKCPCGCKIRRKNVCCNISSRLIQYNDWTRVEPGLAVFTRQKLTRVSFNPGWFLPCKQGLTELWVGPPPLPSLDNVLKSQTLVQKVITQYLRSFHPFAVHSSSGHEGKIIIFERFQCSLTKTIRLN